MPQLQKIDLEI